MILEKTFDLKKTLGERGFQGFIYLLLSFLFFIVLYRTAWLSDDAFITYRCVDNVVQGYGLTYNPGQRVQAFTHPLWAFLHIPFFYLGLSVYHIGIWLSMFVSLATISFCLIKFLKDNSSKAFFVLALISSAAFMDYSTSGLENPLTHLLLALICYFFLFKKDYRHQLVIISALCGLVLLNRMDAILLVAPIWFKTWYDRRSIKSVLIVFLGLVPFMAWELFSIIYYGFPFPMTAYAKLNTSIPRADLIIQGLNYLKYSLKFDPISILMIFCLFPAAIMNKKKDYWLLILGILSYLLYIVLIGGDFMGGRFIAAPFFMALLIIGTILPAKPAQYLSPFVFVLGLMGASPPIFSNALFGKDHDQANVFENNGITDERLYYFQGTGWIASKGTEMPDHSFRDTGEKLRQSTGRYFITGNSGMNGYYAGPNIHILDRFALTDPFLAQLPNIYRPDWRPGHNERTFPRGYLSSLMGRDNFWVDLNLKTLNEAIQFITSGPIWDQERLRMIWSYNLLGKFSDLVDEKFYALPVLVRLNESDLTSSYQDSLTTFQDGGIEIRLEHEKEIESIHFQLQNNCLFTVAFMRKNEIIKGHIIGPSQENGDKPGQNLPGPVQSIDRIIFLPITHQHACTLSHLRIE